MEISTVTVVFLSIVVLAISDEQAGSSGPTLTDRVAVMQEDIKIWKIAALKAKGKRRTLAGRIRLVFAEIDSLKANALNTETQLKVITQEMRHARQESDTDSGSLGKLRGEITEDIRALQLRLNKTVADLRDAKMLKSELNLTNEDLFATKPEIIGLYEDLMALNMTCCGVRKEAKETDGNAGTTAASTTDASDDLTPSKTVPPAHVTIQDSHLQASTTDASDDLTPSKTVPPTPVTTQQCNPYVNPSVAERRLYSASSDGDLEEVKRILAVCHVDINTRGGSYSRTPVLEAAIQKHRDVVELLVDSGADMSLMDKFGNNILHCACYGGDLETTKLIVSLNVVDINSRGEFSWTPLIYAAMRAHRDVIEFLVGRGADVSLVGGFGANALHYASVTGGLEKVKLILSLNVVDINDRTLLGDTAADLARRKGHQGVLDLLVSRGGQCWCKRRGRLCGCSR